MEKQPNLVLVGFMGTGKSAVGRLLARRLKRRLFDTDRWAERQAAMPVAAIFERFGEEAFRALETEAARRVSMPAGLVVSTGGGILGRDENVALLRRGGVLVRLTASPEAILARTAPWEGRPMLRTAPTPREAVERLLAEREPRYALADWTVDTTGLTAEEVADRICSEYPSLCRIAATRS